MRAPCHDVAVATGNYFEVSFSIRRWVLLTSGTRLFGACAPTYGASPEAASEYSTVKKAIFALIGAGALLLLVSQFLPLFHTHVPTTTASVGSGSVGGNHAYGVIPVAILAALLGWAVYEAGNRFALLLVGVLGVAVLAIALGHDLSDSRAHGLRLVSGHYETATNVIGIGLYVEILGALLLLVATVLGLLFGAPSGATTWVPRRDRPRRDRRPGAGPGRMRTPPEKPMRPRSES